MKKHKKSLAVIGAFCSLIITVALLLSSSPKVKFISKSSLSFTESSQLYIESLEKKEIIKNEGAKVVYDSNSSFGSANKNSHTNEIFTCNEITYMDLTVQKNDSTHRVIIKNFNNIYSKYICNNGSSVLSNNNNEEVEKINLNFEECDLTVKQNTVDYVDPFLNSLTAFVQKDREKRPQENVTIPVLNETVSVNVYETMDNPVDSNVKCDFYPAGTDIVIIAMKYKISISTAVDWLSGIELSDDGKFLKDTMICIEKEIDFRYGREVTFSSSTRKSDEEFTVVSDWDTGKSKMKLQQPFEINSKYDCILYSIEKEPYGMALCDQFFVDKAVNSYSNKS